MAVSKPLLPLRKRGLLLFGRPAPPRRRRVPPAPPRLQSLPRRRPRVGPPCPP